MRDRNCSFIHVFTLVYAVLCTLVIHLLRYWVNKGSGSD